MKDATDVTRLVERAQKGDEEAFAQIYQQFSKSVYYGAMKLVGNESDAKDVLQEVMIDLFKNIDTIHSPQYLPLYLNRAAYHRSINLLKKTQGLPVDDTESLAELLPEDNAEFIPEEFAENRERREQIAKLIEELRPNYRAVLKMFYYDELSTKEIAEVLDTKVHVVKVWLQRARHSLRGRLEKGVLKEGVLRAVSVPIMTQIMRENADQLFTSEVSASAWEIVAQQFGFSAAVAAVATSASTTGATTTATAATATTAASTTASTAAGAAALGAGKLTAILVAGGVLAGGVWLVSSTFTPAEEVPVIPPAPAAQSDISSGVLPGDEIDIPSLEEDESVSLPYIPYTPDTVADPHTTPDSAEATTSAEQSGSSIPALNIPPDNQAGGGGRGGRSSSSSGSAPYLSIEISTLTYATGSELLREEIFADAGVKTSYAQDEIEIVGLGDIDTSIPDHYAVLLRAPNGRQIAIIIIIEDPPGATQE